MTTVQERKSCIQCGTCCRKGGPALHFDDMELLQGSFIRPEHLITIRKGEPVYSPLTGRIEPATRELVKINGRQGEWTCYFFDANTSACTIYRHRPLECRLLECWDTEKLVAIINQDALARVNIIHPDDGVLNLIAIHEQECPSLRIKELIGELSGKTRDKETAIRKLTDLVRADLEIRSHAITHYGLSLEVEFFILGRPLFRQLAGLGIDTFERDGAVYLQWNQG